MNIEQVTLLLIGYLVAGVRGAVVVGAISSIARAVVRVRQKSRTS